MPNFSSKDQFCDKPFENKKLQETYTISLGFKKKITFCFFQATEKLPLFYQLIKDNRMAASFNGTVSTLASQQLRITLRQLGSHSHPSFLHVLPSFLPLRNTEHLLRARHHGMQHKIMTNVGMAFAVLELL